MSVLRVTDNMIGEFRIEFASSLGKDFMKDGPWWRAGLLKDD